MPINQQRNLHAREALLAVLRTGRAFAVTGAGLSVWAGYGTWPQLIERLAAVVRENRPGEVDIDLVLRTNRDPLHCAQRLGRFLGNPLFANFIRAEFGPLHREPHDVLYKFISIPFRHLLTFNFEQSLERAHAATVVPCGSISSNSRREMALFLREMDTSEYTRQVVHLHGTHSDPPERMALTEDGYAALYGEPFFTNFLWLLATSQRLVYAGFSFKDSDFLYAIRNAARHVRDNGLCHFAIVGVRPDDDDQTIRNELNELYLIEPVFYPIRMNGDGEDHGGFVELINGIADAVGRPIQPVAPPVPVVGMAVAPDDDDLRRAERLADRIVERADPGGGDVQG